MTVFPPKGRSIFRPAEGAVITRREFLASSGALALSAMFRIGGGQPGIVQLGELNPFWRYTAALGPYLEIGNALMTVPEYMMLGDFPYRKRPFPQEALFADALSIVRLLGGYLIPGVSQKALEERDLAYRDPNGKIGYRMQLLQPRLQPYLDAGYDDLTLVLDNVPYCFPANPVAVGLGQIMPPRDPEEWKAFIVEVARQIVILLGPEKASRLRFRVGTENNSTDRWGGTQAQYIRHYKDSAAAVLQVIPEARISFYNISSAIVQQIPTQNVNSFALAESCYRGDPPAPIDFIAFSNYYWQENDPQQVSNQSRVTWDEFGKLVPALKNCSREIQEFGIATWLMTAAGQPSRSEPGALGAAQMLQMTFWQRAAGTKRLWHWNPLDTEIRDGEGILRSLPTGQAWVYLILDQMAGGEAFLSPVTSLGDGVERLAVGSLKQDSAMLVVSAYHPSGASGPATTIEFPIPQIPMRHAPRIAHLNDSNCVHSLVRNDLANNSLLLPAFAANLDYLGYVREMENSPQGEVLAWQNKRKYINAWADSLTLRPLTPQDGSFDGNTFRLQLATPEVAVLVL
jgi:hypothetical protein